MTTPPTPALLKLAVEGGQPQASVTMAAQRGDWVHQQTLPADAENGLEIIWLHAHAPVELHFIQDDIAGQAYLALVGPAEALKSAETALRASLPLANLAEVLGRNRQTSRSSSASRLSTLPGLIAVLGPSQYNAKVMHALADLLGADDANVRLRSLAAIARLGWPELRPLVIAAAKADEQDFVRWRAADLLLAYDHAAGN